MQSLFDPQAFDSEFRSTVAYPGLKELFEKSPTLQEYLQNYLAIGGIIKVGKAGYGSYCDSEAKTITIDAELLDGSYNLGSLCTILGHEMGHGLDEKYNTAFDKALDPVTAAHAGLHGEGVALEVEYRVATELGVRMYSSSGEPGIQDQMSRSSDRIETGAEWTADMNPSTAQHLTYLMYYAASFGFDKAGVAVTADQWQEIKSPAIEISYPDEGGYHFKATLPPSARDFHFNSVSAQFDEAGVPIQIDTEYTKGGETFTRSLELREEGDYSETITNVDDPESAIVRTVAKAEPLPEAESIDAPENTEPESKAFKLVSFVKDRFIPRYQIRTFIPTRHEQVAQPEDVQDDTPSINP